jgi:hypothetical protein
MLTIFQQNYTYYEEHENCHRSQQNIGLIWLQVTIHKTTEYFGRIIFQNSDKRKYTNYTRLGKNSPDKCYTPGHAC